MCTYVTETVTVSGSAKGPDGWFRVTDGSVYFDHPVHAPAEHTLNIDFLAPGQGPSARVAVELHRRVGPRPGPGDRVRPGAGPRGPRVTELHSPRSTIPMSDAFIAETITIAGHGGDEIEAYSARLIDPGQQVGGVVVIHHMPGYDAQTKEIARNFAYHGYNAIDARTCTTGRRPGPAPTTRPRPRGPRAACPTSASSATWPARPEYLSALPASNGKVGVIGYCSGGRQSFLAAVSLQLDAAVDCYGAFVVGDPPKGTPLKVGPIGRPGAGACPARCSACSARRTSTRRPQDVKVLDDALTAAGKAHEFHVYENTGHAFFAVNRPAYRPEAANDGWQKIFAFYGEHLSA